MKKVSVIGAGNMGGAVAGGLARFRDKYDVTETTAHAHTLEKYALEGMHTEPDNRVAAVRADIVILGVKPWQVFPVLEEIKDILSGKLLVSLAAGIPKDEMSAWLASSGVRGGLHGHPEPRGGDRRKHDVRIACLRGCGRGCTESFQCRWEDPHRG